MSRKKKGRAKFFKNSLKISNEIFNQMSNEMWKNSPTPLWQMIMPTLSTPKYSSSQQ